MVRKFLYAVAIVLVLFIVARVALTFFAEDLTEMAFVPNEAFTAQPPVAKGAYADGAMWIARPGLSGDPSRWLPQGAGSSPDATGAKAAVFFVHPTSYMEKDGWNAALDNAVANDRARLFTQLMASAFTGRGEIWAPRYRQATVGAFFTAKPEADKALDLAYTDVLAAFDAFMAANPEGPIVLAGHSQGSYLLRRLLRDRVAGQPVAGRVVAAYLPGWPVSTAHDLPKTGLPPCTAPDEAGCLLSWLSVADPADTSMLVKGYERRIGLDGKPVNGSPFVCVNPLTGTQDGQNDATANAGTLVPDFKGASGELVAHAVPAACGPDHFLHIGPAPKLEMGDFVMPGNNYHVYDVTLFWANLRADMERRLAAWNNTHGQSEAAQ